MPLSGVRDKAGGGLEGVNKSRCESKEFLRPPGGR